MIVVDTNIICYFYLTSEYSQQAEELYQRESTWAAPVLWRSEFRNVLAMYLRKKLLTFNEIIEIMREAEKLMISNEYTIDSSDVLQLMKNSDCSSYDCEFVALAQELGVSLVTMDKKLLKSFPKYTISLSDIYAKS